VQERNGVLLICRAQVSAHSCSLVMNRYLSMFHPQGSVRYVGMIRLQRMLAALGVLWTLGILRLLGMMPALRTLRLLRRFLSHRRHNSFGLPNTTRVLH
jgi:hypothetical protein